MVVDAIRDALNEARTYEATLVSAGPQPEPTSVNLELGGLKLERITSEMDKLRRRNEAIVGELVFGDEGAVLRARVDEGPILVVGPFPARPNELEGACQRLALKVLEESNPGIAGVVYQNRRKLDEAIRLYQEWLRREYGNTNQAARAHFYLGVAYDLQGEYNQAQGHYEAAVKLKPDFPEALGNLGLILERKGQFTAAITDYGRALDLRPDDVGTLVNLGAALAMQGKYEDAIAEYRKAVELEPTTPALHLGLAGVLQRAGRKDEAQQEFAEADRLSGPARSAPVTRP
jgi:tetratricopeptide (TPR) repeat protein